MADVNTNMRKDAFFALIYAPNYKKHLDFAGYVRSISSVNSEGNFDVLPMHENFVTLLLGKLVVVDEKGKSLEFQVEQALLEASNNLVRVYVDF